MTFCSIFMIDLFGDCIKILTISQWFGDRLNVLRPVANIQSVSKGKYYIPLMNIGLDTLSFCHRPEWYNLHRRNEWRRVRLEKEHLGESCLQGSQRCGLHVVHDSEGWLDCVGRKGKRVSLLDLLLLRLSRSCSAWFQKSLALSVFEK